MLSTRSGHLSFTHPVELDWELPLINTAHMKSQGLKLPSHFDGTVFTIARLLLRACNFLSVCCSPSDGPLFWYLFVLDLAWGPIDPPSEFLHWLCSLQLIVISLLFITAFCTQTLESSCSYSSTRQSSWFCLMFSYDSSSKSEWLWFNGDVLWVPCHNESYLKYH